MELVRLLVEDHILYRTSRIMYVLILALATCMHLVMAAASYVVQVSTLAMEVAQQLVHSDNIQIKLPKPA